MQGLRAILVFLLLCLLLAAVSRGEPGGVLTVDATNPAGEDLDGDNLFRTITAAVQAAAAGAVIEVAPGRYDQALGERFPITIDKDLSIEASSSLEETVIDASGVPEAIVIRFGSASRRASSLRGFTIQGASGAMAAGIAILGSVHSVKLIGNVVQEITAPAGSYAFGIRVYQAETGLVEVADNIVQRVAGNGISVGHSSAAVTIHDNLVTEVSRATIDDAEYSVGIAINASTGVIIEGNEISRAALGISLMGSSGCLVRRNIIHENLQQEPLSHPLLTLAGVEIATPGEGILLAFGSHDNAVLENKIEDNGTGIGLYLADANEIGNNLVKDNRATMISWQGETARGLGIAVDYSHRNEILNNTIEGNGDVGLVLKNAALNRVSGNSIVDHSDAGIVLIEGNGKAINSIMANRIRGAARAGIKIKSGYSEIKGNEITTNGVGIELLETAAAQDHLVQGNDIFSNDFGLINNGRGVARAEENWWGDPSGPYHPRANPSGKGDAVSDGVDFQPWRTTELGGG